MQWAMSLDLKFPISKNSVFKGQEFVCKNWQKSSKKIIAGSVISTQVGAKWVPPQLSSPVKEDTRDILPRVVGEGMGRGNGESIIANAMTSRSTNVTKTNQCPAFVAHRRKEVCMHPHAEKRVCTPTKQPIRTDMSACTSDSKHCFVREHSELMLGMRKHTCIQAGVLCTLYAQSKACAGGLYVDLWRWSNLRNEITPEDYGGVGYFSNERGFSVESSLQQISSNFLLWKRNDSS